MLYLIHYKKKCNNKLNIIWFFTFDTCCFIVSQIDMSLSFIPDFLISSFSSTISLLLLLLIFGLFKHSSNFDILAKEKN